MYKLAYNDKIIIVKILEPTYQYWLKGEQFLFFDNNNNSIKSHFFKLRDQVHFSNKDFAIILIDNRYELIQYGFVLKKIFMLGLSYKIRIEYTEYGFLNYDQSHVILDDDISLDFNNSEIESLTSEYNNIKNKKRWDTEENFDKLYNFFKKNDLTKLPQMKIPLRRFKFKVLMNTEKNELFDFLEIYSSENKLTDEQEEILIKGGELIYDKLKKVLEK